MNKFNGQIDPIELLPPRMVYVHASEGQVYGAGARVFNYALTAAQVKDVMNNGAINFGPSTGSP